MSNKQSISDGLEDLYAIAIMAQKMEGFIAKTVSSARLCSAKSEHEAIGRGTEAARKSWPESDGWYSHQACVAMVPRDAVKVIAEQYKKSEERP